LWRWAFVSIYSTGALPSGSGNSVCAEFQNLRLVPSLNWVSFEPWRTQRMDALNFTFLPDDLAASELPRWVSTAKQTTDGYLLQLASANGIQLATLEERFPERF
jgi:hypothetical protein